MNGISQNWELVYLRWKTLKDIVKFIFRLIMLNKQKNWLSLLEEHNYYFVLPLMKQLRKMACIDIRVSKILALTAGKCHCRKVYIIWILCRLVQVLRDYVVFMQSLSLHPYIRSKGLHCPSLSSFSFTGCIFLTIKYLGFFYEDLAILKTK